MIKVVVFKREPNIIYGIEISGHAGFGQKGEDIVCAGVSALTYTLLNSLEELLNIHTECEISNGYVKCFLPDDIKDEKFEKSQLIFKTIIVGLNNMRDSYSAYIDVMEKEV